MPADFLSRLTIDNLCAIDPFMLDLFSQQAADPDVIKLKHFSQHASWPHNTPKSIANRLAPLVSKILSQDNTLWIRLSDHNRQRTALLLPARYRKCAMCEAHGSTLSGHDADLKTYIWLTDHYFWPTIKTDIANHIKLCVQCILRKRSSLKKCPCNLYPRPTCQMTEFMSTCLVLSKPQKME